MLNVQRLGVVAYPEAHDLMKDLQRQRINGDIPDTILLLEHPEVVTVGPRARNDGLTPPSDYPMHNVDRGGGLTWHGPGQVVCYPIVKWGGRASETSVAEIINIIEGWVVDSLSAFDIVGSRDERMQGVWVDGRKICSIGLSFLRWVSRHGFTVNLSTPPGRVEGVAGCGLSEDTTTSLSALGYDVEAAAFVEVLLSTAQRHLLV